MGHDRYASLVPSAELMNPLAASAPSAAKVTDATQDLQRVCFVAGHLHKAGSAYGLALFISQVPEEFHLEQPAGLRARNPGCAAPPRTGLSEHIELFVDTLKSMLGKAM